MYCRSDWLEVTGWFSKHDIVMEGRRSTGPKAPIILEELIELIGGEWKVDVEVRRSPPH